MAKWLIVDVGELKAGDLNDKCLRCTCGNCYWQVLTGVHLAGSKFATFEKIVQLPGLVKTSPKFPQSIILLCQLLFVLLSNHFWYHPLIVETEVDNIDTCRMKNFPLLWCY